MDKIKRNITDAERMDWLEENNPCISTTGYEWTISQWGKHSGFPNDDEPWVTGRGKTLRAAIDDAINFSS